MGQTKERRCEIVEKDSFEEIMLKRKPVSQKILKSMTPEQRDKYVKLGLEEIDKLNEKSKEILKKK